MNWIFAKITLNDFDLFNHINSDIVNKRRFVHEVSFKIKISRNDLNAKVKREITFLK
jgi:hypothetical protein